MHLHVQKLRFYHPCCSSPRGHKCWIWNSYGERSSHQTLLPYFVTFPRGVCVWPCCRYCACPTSPPRSGCRLLNAPMGFTNPILPPSASEGCSHPETRQGMASKQDAPRRVSTDTFSSSNSLINLNSAQLHKNVLKSLLT